MKTQTCNAKSIAFINVPLPFAPTFLKFDIAELLALFAGFFLGLVSGCACYYIYPVFSQCYGTDEKRT